MRKYEPVRELVQELTGWEPSAGTVTKWKRSGLKTLRLGGRICVNRQVMLDFLEASSEPNSTSGPKERSEASTAKALEQVDRELSELGI